MQDKLINTTPVFKNDLLEAIISPVCVADGGYFGDSERSFIDFLKRQNIDFVEVEMLYSKKFDLSEFPTIEFFTTGTYDEKIQKLFEFDKTNLKTVVVLNIVAFKKVKALATQLNIRVIGFDWLFWDVFKHSGKMDDSVLFDPFKKWG